VTVTRDPARSKQIHARLLLWGHTVPKWYPTGLKPLSRRPSVLIPRIAARCYARGLGSTVSARRSTTSSAPLRSTSERHAIRSSTGMVASATGTNATFGVGALAATVDRVNDTPIPGGEERHRGP
jgi:hypothetical protein